MPVPTIDPIAEFTAAAEFAALRMKSAAGFACQACGRSRYYHSFERPRIFECLACHTQRSVTAGTLLHRTHVSLVEWVIAAKHAEDGGTAAELARKLDRRYETAWRMLHRIRLAFPTPAPVPEAPPKETSRARWPLDRPLAIPNFERARAHFLVVPVGERLACVPTSWDTWRQHNGAAGFALVQALTLRIRRVHRYVSPRWYPAYFRQHEADGHRRALPDLLGGARRTWRELVLPPPWLSAAPAD